MIEKIFSGKGGIRLMNKKGRMLGMLLVAALVVGQMPWMAEKAVADEDIDVTEISIDPVSLSLTVGDDSNLTATVVPENATKPTVNWISQDESIAAVDGNGNVTATGIGSTIITAKWTEDDSISANCSVRVKGNIDATVQKYEGEYDAKEHGIEITVNEPDSGAVIKYMDSDNSYVLDECPTITNVNDSPKTIYYRITAEDYHPFTGFETVTINPADP